MNTRLTVSRVARTLSFVILIFMIAMVIGVTYFFVDPEVGRAVLLQRTPSDGSVSLSNGTIRSMLFVGLATVAVELYLLWQARVLFDLYAQENYLSRECADSIRNLGLGLIALPVIRFIQEPIWSILMTLESEDISVSIAVSSEGIGFLIGGSLMLLIGLAMVEASNAAEENRGFV